MRLKDAFTATRAGVVGVVAVAVGLLAPGQAAATGVSGPTDLRVDNVTSTSIALSWSEPEDMNGFYYYSVQDDDRQIGWSRTTSVTLEADPSTTYDLTVRTQYYRDGWVISEPSNAVTVTTPPDTEPPETPDPLRVLFKTATSVAFYKSLARDNVPTWAPDYVIEVDDGPRFVPVTIGQAGGFWSVTGLATNSTHTFRVKAIDAAGNESGWSDAVSVSIEDEPPTVPSNIRVEGDLVVWDPSTDNSGAVRYEVFFDPANGPIFNISGGSQPKDDFAFWLDVAEAYGPGEHLFTVEAIDPSQNRSGHSDPFVIIVD